MKTSYAKSFTITGLREVICQIKIYLTEADYNGRSVNVFKLEGSIDGAIEAMDQTASERALLSLAKAMEQQLSARAQTVADMVEGDLTDKLASIGFV